MIIFYWKTYHKFKKQQKINFLLPHPLHFLSTFSIETTSTIMKNLGKKLFFIIVDESCDVSIKEQIAIVLHYIDFECHVIEHISKGEGESEDLEQIQGKWNSFTKQWEIVRMNPNTWMKDLNLSRKEKKGIDEINDWGDEESGRNEG